MTDDKYTLDKRDMIDTCIDLLVINEDMITLCIERRQIVKGIIERCEKEIRDHKKNLDELKVKG